ncbi:MAG: tRNA (adenosine(37)-N6)-threonylcarbamoyltransferase complex dimerization subunit type 1 TsaB [Burkholderiaceae bacterium]|jgi:tRNA threonylcarbamoyladenosine biosynthesis protein TsaB|nr:tRNA (adenosine(37)-N6)-threonylcarbamoyltransferase complex dimerization subunit type 1 TsaB [Burkholderiaceae bacterium]
MKCLAFDTSGEQLSVAVQHGARVWPHRGAGGAQASATLIPAALDLLGQAGLRLDQLDALSFTHGPGAFTGLRTACAVAQGLALGARAHWPGQAPPLPVVPVDTLLAVAENARQQVAASAGDAPFWALSAIDARMDEVYWAAYQWLPQSGWRALTPVRASAPEQLAPPPLPPSAQGAIWHLAGNASAVYGARLRVALPPDAARVVAALPDACALLALTPALLAAGRAVAPEQALPLYIRDKVAQTTAERAALRAAAATATVANG